MGFHQVSNMRGNSVVSMEVDDISDGVYIHLYGPRGGGRDTAVMTVEQTEALIDDLKEQLRRVEGRKIFLGGDCHCFPCRQSRE